jgi:hypothetical protein
MKKSICSVAGLFALIVLSAFSPKLMNGEFEGTYQIGTDTCSVRPVKMAFEVIRDKGKPAAIFFYESESQFGRYTYISEKKESGYDRFVFANDSHVSGEYISSNGIRYSLTKIR